MHVMLSQRSLEAFRAVMEVGSVSGAADFLNISQPAVSRLIKDLEMRTDLRLFIRLGGRVVPTAEAHELALEVERSFVGLAEIKRAADGIRQGQRGALTIASMPALAHSILPDVVSCMCVDKPDVRITLISMQTHNVIRHVASRQCQLGITSPTRYESAVELIGSSDLAYSCILPQGHALSDLDKVSFHDLAGLPFIGFNETTATGRMLDRHFARMRNPPVIRIRSHMSVIVSALVQRGLGVSVVDPFTARLHQASGGVVLPIDIDDRFRFAVIRPIGDPPNADLTGFLEVFESVLDSYRQDDMALANPDGAAR